MKTRLDRLGTAFVAVVVLVELFNSQSVRAQFQTWSATAPLPSALGQPTATFLQNGKVLVAGGDNGQAANAVANVGVTGAELYDPATATWTTTGSMSYPRYAQTSTLLPNGRVLVAGGIGNGQTLSSAELYDPATGTWTPTGSMSQPRYGYVATLLPNGLVLVAGGFSYNSPAGYISSAELYNPATGTWAATGPMITPRLVATATLLPDGKVLVAGGYDANFSTFLTSLTEAELYNPATGTWSATGSMAAARAGHTATLLPNGKVLVAGGFDGNPNAVQAFLASVELYDPATGTWALTGAMNVARADHTATLLAGGQLLVAGGVNGPSLAPGNVGIAGAELYDPAAGIWTLTGSLITARSQQAATLLPNGNVIVAGGYGTSGAPISSAEVYDNSCAALNIKLEAEVSSLTAQNGQLQAQNMGLAQQLQTLNSALSTGLGSLGNAIGSSSGNPNFQIPGSTPSQQFQNLVNAILDLNHAQLHALYKELNGK